jgi:hypothetical protein
MIRTVCSQYSEGFESLAMEQRYYNKKSERFSVICANFSFTSSQILRRGQPPPPPPPTHLNLTSSLLRITLFLTLIRMATDENELVVFEG